MNLMKRRAHRTACTATTLPRRTQPDRDQTPARARTATGQQARAGRAGGSRHTAGPAGGRADPAAVGEFIERFAGILYESGVPRMPARVFAALLTADAGQLTAADLAAILGVSPAAVSGGVRYLVQVGLVAGPRASPARGGCPTACRDDVWHQLLRMRNTLLARLDRDPAGRRRAAGHRHARRGAADRQCEYFEFVAGRARRHAGPLGRAPGRAGRPS